MSVRIVGCRVKTCTHKAEWYPVILAYPETKGLKPLQIFVRAFPICEPHRKWGLTIPHVISQKGFKEIQAKVLEQVHVLITVERSKLDFVRIDDIGSPRDAMAQFVEKPK